MRDSGRFILTIILSAVVWAAPAVVTGQDSGKLSRSDLKTLQQSFADLADEVIPSVVAIRTYTGSDGRGDREFLRALSQGSGAIIRSNGFILTNFHVVEEASHIMVILHDGSEHDAGIVQVDERSDLAILKIDADHLKAARLGDLKNLRIGHWTFAIGNPFGLANFTGKASFSVGNVSSFGRNLTDLLDVTDTRYYGNLIETSAAINPGNSGGPLFNIEGEVIGVVTAIETRTGVTEGVGFAIPISDRTRTIISRLERGDEVRYGYLGVRVDKRSPDEFQDVNGARVTGARLGEVLQGPAYAAGLRDGDIVIEFDGIAIHDYDHLVRVVGGTPIGAGVPARYLRRGSVRTATVVLGERPISTHMSLEMKNGERVPTMNWRGAALAEVTPAIRNELQLDADARGLIVVDVRAASEAALHGVHFEQILAEVDGTPVPTFDAFRKACAQAGEVVRLTFTDSQSATFAMPEGGSLISPR